MPAALEHRPDVALLDIGLPGTDGITAAAELARRLPGCRVLILTGMAMPDALSAALRAGVAGYLLKEGSAEHLIGAVRAVARGDRVIDGRLAGQPPVRERRSPWPASQKLPPVGWTPWPLA